MATPYRKEKDLLGELEIPAEALYGIHTTRAMENFALSGRPAHAELIHAYGTVKLACAITNRGLGVWSDERKADAIERACREMGDGLLDRHVVVDALQGGAGTSLNMNVNEVIANRALQLLSEPLGHYERVSPFDDINLHQSTNDTYPTARCWRGCRGGSRRIILRRRTTRASARADSSSGRTSARLHYT